MNVRNCLLNVNQTLKKIKIAPLICNLSSKIALRFYVCICALVHIPKHSHTPSTTGWFNTLAGAMKRQLSNYVKIQTTNNNSPSNSATTSPTNNVGGAVDAGQDNNKSNLFYRTMSAGSSSSPSNSQTTSPSNDTAGLKGSGGNGSEGFQEGSSAGGFIRRYAASTGSGGGGGPSGMGTNINAPGTNSSITATHTPAHILANLDRRHRSPDPPPRYNRGQSPLLLRKNILELSGQPPGTSPMLNRR